MYCKQGSIQSCHLFVLAPYSNWQQLLLALIRSKHVISPSIGFLFIVLSLDFSVDSQVCPKSSWEWLETAFGANENKPLDFLFNFTK